MDDDDVNPNDNKPILWWSMEHTNWSCVCDFIRFITQIIESSKEIMKSMCICTDFIIAKGFENN